MSQASFYGWFSRFSEGNKQVENEPRSGALKSACKEENIQEVQRLVMQDHQMSMRMIPEAVGISIGTVDNNSDQRSEAPQSLCQVSKILSDNQRQFRVEYFTKTIPLGTNQCW